MREQPGGRKGESATDRASESDGMCKDMKSGKKSDRENKGNVEGEEMRGGFDQSALHEHTNIK